jgi:hypothetical protein
MTAADIAARMLMVLLGVFAIAALALPAWIGTRVGRKLDAQGRRRHANLIGWTVLAGAGVMFALSASLNRAEFWATIPAGELIGMAGTFSSLMVLLFGAGLALRHQSTGNGA